MPAPRHFYSFTGIVRNNQRMVSLFGRRAFYDRNEKFLAFKTPGIGASVLSDRGLDKIAKSYLQFPALYDQVIPRRG